MRLILGEFHLESEGVRADWGRRPFSAGLDFRGQGKHDQYRLELPCPAAWSAEKLFQWAVEEVMAYHIFPPSRMRALVDAPQGWVVKGATILQGVFVGSFRLRMADRVLEVFEGEDANERWSGFTYGTLKGHAEQGIETFRVTLEKASGRVQFSMEAWSKPGHWLIQLFYPWARWVQKKAGEEAMQYMKDRLDEMIKKEKS
ncbi:MAG TPA: DUF1990 family protein [bacterium]|nr:DUF1990 family protein [bacterium]